MRITSLAAASYWFTSLMLLSAGFVNTSKIAPVYTGPYRRLLLHDFPYGVFYQVQPSRIVVASVMDLRQDPRSIRRKLFDSSKDS